MKPGKKISLLVGIAIVSTFILLLLTGDISDKAVPVIEWIGSMGAWGPVWLILIYIALIVFLIPSFPLTLAAGFLFGVFQGSLYVVCALAVGGIIAFYLGRYLLHTRISKQIHAYPQLERVSRGLEGNGGWKFVLLCRFVPFFPSKLSNYIFGVTHVRPGAFFIGNLVGVIPYTILNVWMGSLAADLTRLGERNERTPLEWVFYGLGLGAAVVVVFYITRLARGAMEKQLEPQDSPPPPEF